MHDVMYVRVDIDISTYINIYIDLSIYLSI